MCGTLINRLPTLVLLTISARPEAPAAVPGGTHVGAGVAQDGSLIGLGDANRTLG